MPRSSQKFIIRNRAPRVQIEYDVEVYGAEKKVQLPFVQGVLADLSGKPFEALNPVSERRFLEVDVDNFDDRLKSMKPRVAFKVLNTLTGGGYIYVDLTFESMDDFSPAAVAHKVDAVSQLLQTREQLANLITYMDGKSGAEELITKVLSDPNVLQSLASVPKPVDDSDASGSEPTYEQKEGWPIAEARTQAQAQPDAAAFEHSEFSALLEVLRPQSVRAKEAIEIAVQTLAQQALAGTGTVFADVVNTIEAFIAQIDHKLSEQVNKIIHHRDFQKLEGAWRGLHYMVNNTETDEMLKIKILNISKKELHKTLKKFKGTAWDQSPIFEKLYEEGYGQLGGDPFGCLVGDYYFDHSPPDVALLGEMAKIAAAIHAPFISAVKSTVLGMDSWQELANPCDLTKIFQNTEYAAWLWLRESDDARYIGLVMPCFLARLPYGAKTDPVEDFDFEEDTDGADHNKYCWANSAYAMATNINRSFKYYGWCARIRGVESGGAVEWLPTHTFPTDDGGVDMKCPTEIAISDRREAELAKNGFMPLTHRKNSDFAAFISAQSLQKPFEYDDPDATANANLAAHLPYLFAACRFAHYLKCIVRDRVGFFKERAEVQRWLNIWIMQYVDGNPETSSEQTKTRKPLSAAEVLVEEVEGNPGYYASKFFLRPHYQLGGLTVSLRLISKLPKLKDGG